MTTMNTHIYLHTNRVQHAIICRRKKTKKTIERLSHLCNFSTKLIIWAVKGYLYTLC